MKKYSFIIISIYFTLLLHSCGGNKSSNDSKGNNLTSSTYDTTNLNFKRDSIYVSVPVSTNTNETFALYIPRVLKTNRVPVIIFFDPHGGGHFVLQKYKRLADKFHCILIGSNSSKNGMDFQSTVAIANNLINEALLKLPIDSSLIYLAGFSGGGKVAIDAAKQNSLVSAVVYAGAATPLDNANHSFPLLGFAGIDDMNYTFLLDYDKNISAEFPHYLIEWSGKHEWPNESAFIDAFYFIAFDEMKKKKIPTDENLIGAIGYRNEGDHADLGGPVGIYNHFRKEIFLLNGLVPLEEEKNNAAAFEKSNDSVKKYLIDKNNLVALETAQQKMFDDAFTQKDLNWWKAETNRLRINNTGVDGAMNQRLLGYLSLRSYGLLTKLFMTGRDALPFAPKLLEIYLDADPKNADQRYFHALYYALHNNFEGAISQLKEAVALGFNDKQKMATEKAFLGMATDLRFQQIVNSLK